MMVLPLVVIVLLPKVVNTNDPEMRRVSEHKFHVFSMLSIDHMYIYFCFVFLPFMSSFGCSLRGSVNMFTSTVFGVQ